MGKLNKALKDRHKKEGNRIADYDIVIDSNGIIKEVEVDRENPIQKLADTIYKNCNHYISKEQLEEMYLKVLVDGISPEEALEEVHHQILNIIFEKKMDELFDTDKLSEEELETNLDHLVEVGLITREEINEFWQAGPMNQE